MEMVKEIELKDLLDNCKADGMDRKNIAILVTNLIKQGLVKQN